MKRVVWLGFWVTVLAVGLVGCEWNTGDDAESWSSSFNWVNFSGVYRGAGGGLLVTDYTTTPSVPGSTNTFTRTESGGTLQPQKTSASGQVSHGNIIPGSFMVTVGNIATLADTAKDGILAGNGNGTVNYTGGTWSISLDTWSPSSQKINISYSYAVSSDGSTGGGAQSGATGNIYSFNIVQQGQNLTITDNNGAVYQGRIKQMRSATGQQNTDIPQGGDDEGRNDGRMAKYTYQESPLPTDGDMIVANFECSGTSRAGMQVRIVGIFEGTVAAGVFTGRRMDGTWIEAGGKTGNINGQTVAVPIVVAPAAEEEATPEPGGTGTRT